MGIDMLNSILIVTEDSRTILPSRKKWRPKLGTGINLQDHDGINALLAASGLQMPGNDLNNEIEYREVLKDYIRPARCMYAGTFSEIRDFANELRPICNAELYIISGRYGLINQDDDIIPYLYPLNSKEKLQYLDGSSGFSSKICDLCVDKSILIVCLQKHYISYLDSIGWFEKIPKDTTVIMVAGNEFLNLSAKIKNIKFYARKGVCRLGKRNKEDIISLISQMTGN